MSTTATLVYKVTPVPPVSLAQVQAALGAVVLDFASMAEFGAVKTTDTTSNDGTNAIRTIVFNIASAAFEQNFPSADNQQASPFNNLYTHAIGGTLGMVVNAIAPVIA